ncbi:MAG: hypothetical protein QI223_06945 [Candidatus Korarchaeota archaeon]|nr:hypothetical protein [Candidatus Korarchaeota archaeon]
MGMRVLFAQGSTGPLRFGGLIRKIEDDERLKREWKEEGIKCLEGMFDSNAEVCVCLIDPSHTHSRGGRPSGVKYPDLVIAFLKATSPRIKNFRHKVVRCAVVEFKTGARLHPSLPPDKIYKKCEEFYQKTEIFKNITTSTGARPAILALLIRIDLRNSRSNSVYDNIIEKMKKYIREKFGVKGNFVNPVDCNDPARIKTYRLLCVLIV